MGMAVNFTDNGPSGADLRELHVFQSAQTERFGAVYFGISEDRTAAGIWGDGLPFAYMPNKADDLPKRMVSLLRESVPIELDGQAGRLHQPHSGLLMPWSRKRRAVHAEFPDRLYLFKLRWLAHRVVVREGSGQVLRWTGGVFHLHDRADAMDAAVSLLIGWTVSDQYIILFG